MIKINWSAFFSKLYKENEKLKRSKKKNFSGVKYKMEKEEKLRYCIIIEN